MPLRMISNLLPPLLWAIGRPDVSASNNLIVALVMPLAFLVGAGDSAWHLVQLTLRGALTYTRLLYFASKARFIETLEFLNR